MLKPPHITPRGVSSLFLSLSQARMGNLRKLCRSHMEQEPRAELKSPLLHIAEFFGVCLTTLPCCLLSSLDTGAIVPSHGRLEAGTAAHYPSTSSTQGPRHTTIPPCPQPTPGPPCPPPATGPTRRGQLGAGSARWQLCVSP